MRIIQSGEIEKQCSHCKSIIGMFPHEVHHVSADPEEGDAAYSYWDCPACKKRNSITHSFNDFDY